MDQKKSIFGNSMWMISERLLQAAVSLVVSAITRRYLGVDNNGLLAFGSACVSVFLTLSSLGLEFVLIKELIEKPEDEGKILGTSMVMRFAASLFSILAIQIVVFTVKDHSPFYMLIALLQSLELIFKLYEFLDYRFQAQLKYKNVAIAKGITYVIVAFWKFYIVLSAKNVEWFALSAVVDAAVACAILFIMYFRSGGRRFSFSFSVGKYLLRQGRPFVVASLITVLYNTMDKLMLGSICGDGETGIYDAAYFISFIWVFIPNAIMNSYRPVIIEGHARNINYKERMRTLYSILIWLGILVGIGTLAAGRFAILTIGGGSAFLGAVPSLNLLIWSTLFSHLAVARTTWLLCEGLQKYSGRFALFGVIINFILNALMIPRYGATGASFSTLITQITVTVAVPLLYRQTRPSVIDMFAALNPAELINRLKLIRRR